MYSRRNRLTSVTVTLSGNRFKSKIHLINHPSKNGCREDFGGGRGSNGDATAACGHTVNVPPDTIMAPMKDARTLQQAADVGPTLAACSAPWVTADLLVESLAASFRRLPLRLPGNHGKDQAIRWALVARGRFNEATVHAVSRIAADVGASVVVQDRNCPPIRSLPRPLPVANESVARENTQLHVRATPPRTPTKRSAALLALLCCTLQATSRALTPVRISPRCSQAMFKVTQEGCSAQFTSRFEVYHRRSYSNLMIFCVSLRDRELRDQTDAKQKN